ncbi:MAG: threonine--tRNA ligase [Chthoniobacteraceae bacterium]
MAEAHERKSLEQRHQATDTERLRHSAAHVLATAILRLWPNAQFAAGPAVESGFYYDIDLDHRITPEDFPAIEAEMKKEIKANHTFERKGVTRDEALKLAQAGRLGALSEREKPSIFKIGNLEEIPEGEEISLYQNGDFIDLCAGPHVMRTGNIGAYKLTHVASAYYKGDEKNPQLQRIYGTAFKNKTEMEAYFSMLEEAKKRDHRKLGKELELFCFDEDVGPGLPLWMPRGTVLLEELEKLAKETEFAAGYERVRTPHIARANMYLTSGHLPYYAESMFPPMRLMEPSETKILQEIEGKIRRLNIDINGFIENLVSNSDTSGSLSEEMVNDYHFWEGELIGLLNSGSLSSHLQDPSIAYQPLISSKFQELKKLLRKRDEILTDALVYLKAMNCPHHHKIFGAVPRSYRDLPLRLAEYGTCYRYEQSGELFGLMRVRSMQMNDAHIYLTEDQFEAEFNAVNEMYLKYFKIFGIDKYLMRFSTHDPAKLGQKFVDQPELWKKTEDMVRNVLIKSGINYVEVPNEAAFYGPKIDVQVWSAIGREFTIATNQVDFAVPSRFDLVYKDRDNTEKTPLCIHRAPLGTHERFIGFLIEHYAGNFPFWLAPEQVRVLPIGDETPLIDYANSIRAELRAAGIRAEVDASSNNIKGKVLQAEQMKVHTMLVVGNRDLEAGNVSVRLHGKGNIGAKPRAEVIADLIQAARERRA